MALGDRIAVMVKGNITKISTPDEIYRAPVNAFVADFIGTINRVFSQQDTFFWWSIALYRTSTYCGTDV